MSDYNQIDKAALDRYITGGDYHKEIHTVRCPNCEHTQEAEMQCEYGGCEPVNENDVYCPNCNIEMESI